MARRQSTFEDLMDITSRLPWFVGVALAAISYFICHAYATATGTGRSELGKAFAMLGQIVLPVGFLAGATISYINRNKRRELMRVATTLGSIGIDCMTWHEFEVLIGESFRQRGYEAIETGGNGADGGYDLILKKGGERFLVQCKQWRAQKVAVSTVRELFGVIAAEEADGGFVVTSGTFTSDAKEFARANSVELIDGSDLARLFAGKTIAPTSVAAAPPCPRCGSAMVRREARRGATAGREFWGCRRYPSCRATQAMD